jgi:N-acetylglucosamine-6-phosphate deacetylase
LPISDHREPGIIGLLGAAPGSHENVNGKHLSQTLKSALSTPVASQVLSKIERLAGVESPLPSMETKTSESNNQNSRPFQRPFWSCIADGLHVHPFAVNLAYQTHPEGCVLVTDGRHSFPIDFDCLLMLFSIAVSWMDPNLPEGVYPWRSQDHTVTKRGDSITLTDTDTLAGAAVPLDKSVRNLAKFCGIPLSKAIHCASRNPAKCLGGSVVKSKGALKVGFDADLTVWDKKTGELLSTWRAGRQVFGKLELQNPT